jgi:hypothetical protein
VTRQQIALLVDQNGVGSSPWAKRVDKLVDVGFAMESGIVGIGDQPLVQARSTRMARDVLGPLRQIASTYSIFLSQSAMPPGIVSNVRAAAAEVVTDSCSRTD